MIFKNEGAEIFIFDNEDENKAIKRTTHMCVGAHPDDIEIMAYDGINKCYLNDNNWFLGVVITNGAGSSKDRRYKDYTDEMLIKRRKLEQKKSAFIGEYGAQILLDYTSDEIKTKSEVTNEIRNLIMLASPEIIYTHNLADKHDTHVATSLRVIEAIRQIPKELRPQNLIGIEVWRSLDWMKDEDKIIMNVDKNLNIAKALIEVHDSQISGGKSYDDATMGRRLTNATFLDAYIGDKSKSVIVGMDLTKLIENDSLDIENYVSNYIDEFKHDVLERIKKYK